MKEGEKLMETASEVLDDASVVESGADAIDGGGDSDSHKDASFAEKENTQLQNEEDSGEEVVDEEGEEDGVTVVAGSEQGSVLDDGFFGVEAIRRRRLCKVKFLLPLYVLDFYFYFKFIGVLEIQYLVRIFLFSFLF